MWLDSWRWKCNALNYSTPIHQFAFDGQTIWSKFMSFRCITWLRDIPSNSIRSTFHGTEIYFPCHAIHQNNMFRGRKTQQQKQTTQRYNASCLWIHSCYVSPNEEGNTRKYCQSRHASACAAAAAVRWTLNSSAMPVVDSQTDVFAGIWLAPRRMNRRNNDRMLNELSLLFVHFQTDWI